MRIRGQTAETKAGKTLRRTAMLASALVLAACASAPPPAPPPPLPAPVYVSPEDAAFAKFVRDFRAVALEDGISPDVYDAAMASVRRVPQVTAQNRSQPEFARPIWTYLDGVLAPGRIAGGKAKLAEEAEPLAAAEARYGVPKEILAAVWGMETDYGRTHGRYNLFSALANLAYAGRRADYARPQLLAALLILQEENLTPSEMTSSWAGAFGQTQFVPTTFLAKAVDGDGDGKVDLWHSPADALFSTAHLFADAGWRAGEPWGYEVKLPAGFDYGDGGLDKTLPAMVWAARGVTAVLPKKAEDADPAAPASVFLPAGAAGPAFLVFDNFRVVLKYNHALSYALGVCLLADRLAGDPPLAAAWPRSIPPLKRSERLALQQGLSRLGFDVGGIDGVIGTKTRAAVRAFQKAHGLAADGYATPGLVARIVAGAADGR